MTLECARSRALCYIPLDSNRALCLFRDLCSESSGHYIRPAPPSVAFQPWDDVLPFCVYFIRRVSAVWNTPRHPRRPVCDVCLTVRAWVSLAPLVPHRPSTSHTSQAHSSSQQDDSELATATTGTKRKASRTRATAMVPRNKKARTEAPNSSPEPAGTQLQPAHHVQLIELDSEHPSRNSSTPSTSSSALGPANSQPATAGDNTARTAYPGTMPDTATAASLIPPDPSPYFPDIFSGAAVPFAAAGPAAAQQEVNNPVDFRFNVFFLCLNFYQNAEALIVSLRHPLCAEAIRSIAMIR